MKSASIFHGTGSTPDSFWHPYLKRELEKLGYQVWLPQLPDTDHPDIKNWLPFALNNGTYDSESVLIGHSAGCPLILSTLENIDIKVKLVILVAGFTTNLTENEKEPILQDSYDWEKIKSRCENFVFINSDNDPWGCNDKEGRKMLDNLGGDLIIRNGQGHMGSDKFNQPYRKYPLLVKLVESYT